MRSLHFFLFIFIALFLAACGASNDVKPTVITQSSSLPSWYTESHENDKQFIYGVGMGKTRKEALNAALADAVSTLNVSVSSNYHQSTSSTTDNGAERYRESSEQSIDVIAKEMTLNNYDIVHQEELAAQKNVVMIKINRYKLFEQMNEDIKNNFGLLNAKLQHVSNELEKILIYRKFMALLKGQMEQLGIMHSLNPAFDDTAFKQQYKAVINTHNQLIENKLFKLEVNDPYGVYTTHIREGLAKDGVKLTRGNDYDYVMRVSIREESKIAVRRQVITFLTTYFSVGLGDNNSNKDIFFTNFKLKSQSDVSIEDARNKITEELIEKIKRHGVFNIPRV